jgi:hypothetical protein
VLVGAACSNLIGLSSYNIDPALDATSGGSTADAPTLATADHAVAPAAPASAPFRLLAAGVRAAALTAGPYGT